MSRAAFLAAFAAALALGLALRLIGLDARPVHHDEANQAVKFGALLEEGRYRYDRNDHHGPTLYYLSLPAAWLMGQARLAALDERTLRAVPAVFGAGLVLLVALFARHIGRGAAASAALLAAVSPALTYYSRFYIQESLFAFFTVAFLLSLGRYHERPAGGTAALAGLLAGLAYATKETSVIVVSAGLAAWIVAARPWRAPRPWRWSHLAAALAAGAGVSFLFYSSFLAHPAGFVESILAFGIYLERGVDTSRHVHAWDYYLRTLGWSAAGGLVWTEAFVLALAAAGTVAAFGMRGARAFWPRYLALYSWFAALVFSLLRYKTPWNVLPFHAGFVLIAGVGVSAIAGWPPRGRDAGPARSGPRLASWFAVVALIAGAAHLGLQSWRASVRYAADPRNPYVYAHTSPDFLRLVRRVEGVSSAHPDGSGMLVKVFAGPYEQWPLPWYLRRMPHVGYWSAVSDATTVEAPVVIASQDNAAAVETALGDGYVSEFYGLRPGVLLAVFIEQRVWDRYLDQKARTRQR